VVADFTDLSLSAAQLVSSGLVTDEELTASGLVDPGGNVSLHQLVASELVFLEELIRDDFVQVDDLSVGDVLLGNLLATPLVDIQRLIADDLVGVSALLSPILICAP